MAFAAPRILKEPMDWRHSSLSQISREGPRTSSRTRGVRNATSEMRSRAAWMASSSIGAIGIMCTRWPLRDGIASLARRDITGPDVLRFVAGQDSKKSF